MNAYEKLLGTCSSVGVTEPIELVEAFKDAQFWVRQISRYESLVGKKQEVKWALATVFEKNEMTLSGFLASNLDNHCGLNFTGTKSSLAMFI